MTTRSEFIRNIDGNIWLGSRSHIGLTDINNRSIGLASSASAGDIVLDLNNVKHPDLNANIIPGDKIRTNKREVKEVSSVDTSTDTITLKEPLAFDYSDSDQILHTLVNLLYKDALLKITSSKMEDSWTGEFEFERESIDSDQFGEVRPSIRHAEELKVERNITVEGYLINNKVQSAQRGKEILMSMASLPPVFLIKNFAETVLPSGGKSQLGDTSEQNVFSAKDELDVVPGVITNYSITKTSDQNMGTPSWGSRREGSEQTAVSDVYEVTLEFAEASPRTG